MSCALENKLFARPGLSNETTTHVHHGFDAK